MDKNIIAVVVDDNNYNKLEEKIQEYSNQLKDSTIGDGIYLALSCDKSLHYWEIEGIEPPEWIGKILHGLLLDVTMLVANCFDVLVEGLNEQGIAILEPVNNDEGHDPVNNPSHYQPDGRGVECINITEQLSFNIGNAVKYIWRHDNKGNPVEDLEKARWYINRALSGGIMVPNDDINLEGLTLDPASLDDKCISLLIEYDTKLGKESSGKLALQIVNVLIALERERIEARA